MHLANLTHFPNYPFRDFGFSGTFRCNQQKPGGFLVFLACLPHKIWWKKAHQLDWMYCLLGDWTLAKPSYWVLLLGQFNTSFKKSSWNTGDILSNLLLMLHKSIQRQSRANSPKLLIFLGAILFPCKISMVVVWGVFSSLRAFGRLEFSSMVFGCLGEDGWDVDGLEIRPLHQLRWRILDTCFL